LIHNYGLAISSLSPATHWRPHQTWAWRS